MNLGMLIAMNNGLDLDLKEPTRNFHRAFLEVAEIMATLSTCSKRGVGAVAVRNRRILSAGFNGAPSGLPHQCRLEGEERKVCTSCVHAEANVIAQASLHGVSLSGSTIYCTAAPCRGCAGLIINAGVKEVYYRRLTTAGLAGLEVLEAAGILITKEEYDSRNLAI